MTLDEIVRWFERLTRESVADVGRYYAEDAFFKDPFNEVTGVEAVRRVFAHMFDQVEGPRFRVRERWQDAHGAMLTWTFEFRLRGESWTIRGATHLRFAADGRITHHRDYWDAAEELYAKLPVLGAVMRALQRRGRA
ncbi:MAG: nuclear transport factor 2 family protein [Bacteroidota bacterium]